MSKKNNAFLSVITWISILGVAVGVMALTIVLSAISGFQNEFRQKILGNNAPLIVFSSQGEIENHLEVEQIIKSTQNVQGVNSFVYSEVLVLSHDNRQAGVVVYGVDPNKVVTVTSLSKDMVNGDLKHLVQREGRLPGIVLGQSLARDHLYVDVGSIVSVLMPTGELTPFGFGPKLRRFEVVGVFKSGLYEYDTKSAYVDLPVAQSLMGYSKNTVKGMQVGVVDISQIRATASKLHQRLSKDFYIRDWMEMNAALFDAFKLEKTVFFLVVVMIVLVASFNIIGTLTLLVMTKVKEIAILKAMGAKDFSIAKIFMFCGTWIGLIGTALGLTLGYFGCLLLERYFPFPLDANVYQVDHLPMKISLLEFFYVAACAIVIGFLSTIYPAFNAAKVEPSLGIRNE